jgi:hypothetical protein
MNDKLLILRLMRELKDTQVELAATKLNHDEWKAEAKRLKEARQ